MLRHRHPSGFLGVFLALHSRRMTINIFNFYLLCAIVKRQKPDASDQWTATVVTSDWSENCRGSLKNTPAHVDSNTSKYNFYVHVVDTIIISVICVECRRSRTLRKIVYHHHRHLTTQHILFKYQVATRQWLLIKWSSRWIGSTV